MSQGIAIIIMGGKSDLDHAKKIAENLEKFEIESVMRIASAHKTPARLLEMISAYEGDGRPKVYITIAGLSNGLSGMVDGAVKNPVLSCPPLSDKFAGADIYSSIRMPPGIAPAFVLDPANAALCAAKILGLSDAGTARKVELFQSEQRRAIAVDDGTIQR